ncbi:hypothetical protein DIPPA_29376 [Diplonema papillatum]|nr:hypothetical protein DIPPA_29376 [Diplonema papillatum]
MRLIVSLLCLMVAFLGVFATALRTCLSDGDLCDSTTCCQQGSQCFVIHDEVSMCMPVCDPSFDCSVIPPSAPASATPSPLLDHDCLPDGIPCDGSVCCQPGSRCYVLHDDTAMCMPQCDSQSWDCSVISTATPSPLINHDCLPDGIHCDGSVCCQPGSRCFVLHDDTAMCMPQCDSQSWDCSVISMATPAPLVDHDCLPDGIHCDGSVCCQPGSLCFVLHDDTAMCMPECDSQSWNCSVISMATPSPLIDHDCLPDGIHCDGSVCCQPGSFCFILHNDTAMCMPECDSQSWNCSVISMATPSPLIDHDCLPDGIHCDGSVCCQPGSFCFILHDDTAMCMPECDSQSWNCSVISMATPSPLIDHDCLPDGIHCDGSVCCQPGSFCFILHDDTAMCMPGCDSQSWDCSVVSTTAPPSPLIDHDCLPDGIHCDGSVCCQPGSFCFILHDDTAMCMPECDSQSWDCSVVSTTPPPAPPSPLIDHDCLPDGIRCDGSVCCQPGSQCYVLHDDAAMCMRSCDGDRWACTVVGTQTPAAAVDYDCLADGMPCDGSGCCQEGSRCYVLHDGVAMCMPRCGPSWSCAELTGHPAAPADADCLADGAPCDGTRCCQAGSHCFVLQAAAAKCLPTCASPWDCRVLDVLSPTPAPEFLPDGTPCSGAVPCEGASQCFRLNAESSMCMPFCDPGFDCTVVTAGSMRWAPPPPRDAPLQECLPVGSPCDGSVRCQAGAQCFKLVDETSMCMPACAGWDCTEVGGALPPTEGGEPTAKPWTFAPVESCLPDGATCDGSACCLAGSQCFVLFGGSAMCMPACNAGWDCAVVPLRASTRAPVAWTSTPFDPSEGCQPIGTPCDGSVCCQTGAACYRLFGAAAICLPTCGDGSWDCASVTVVTAASPSAPPATDVPSDSFGGCLPVGTYCGGSICCQTGTKCYSLFKSVAMCMPMCLDGWDCILVDTPQPPSTAEPGLVSVEWTASPSDADCLTVGTPCDGSVCCETGSQCYTLHGAVAMCMPTCERGWDCTVLSAVSAAPLPSGTPPIPTAESAAPSTGVPAPSADPSAGGCTPVGGLCDGTSCCQQGTLCYRLVNETAMCLPSCVDWDCTLVATPAPSAAPAAPVSSTSAPALPAGCISVGGLCDGTSCCQQGTLCYRLVNDTAMCLPSCTDWDCTLVATPAPAAGVPLTGSPVAGWTAGPSAADYLQDGAICDGSRRCLEGSSCYTLVAGSSTAMCMPRCDAPWVCGEVAPPAAGCAEDVRECPDGSFVSREPLLHCDFASCPPLPAVDCPADVRECPDGSYVSRDPLLHCGFASCPPPPTVDCPADVRECPDGSFVSREPLLHCDFASCPPLPAVDCPADVRECPDGSYVQRDPLHHCAFATCPPPPAAPCASVLEPWQECRGSPGCCKPGFQCFEMNAYYAQCRETCTGSEGWSCRVLS